ncbi:MAG: hypothetical protein AAFX06_06430 [Planctomycetota bacterium]
MRNDDLEIAEVPTDDRPGDGWMFDAEGQGSRTWTGKRQQIGLAATLTFAILFGSAFAFVPRSVLFKPGPLSSPHAQILAGTLTSERCSACHQDAALSTLGSDSAAHSQSQLCLNCHEQMMDRSLATKAHNLPSSVRDQLSAKIRRSGSTTSLVSSALIPTANLDHENVACSTCHKEHHGADADLNAMTNAQCQSCHSVRFGAFATSHPDWDSWPYGRGGEIAFDHVTHLRKHSKSAADAERLQCARCHPSGNSLTGGIELARSASYEIGCAACHDEGLTVQAATGIAVLTIPTIPASSADGIGWPDLAVGFPDGVIPPLTELLLRSDPEVAAALRRLPKGDVSAILKDDMDETTQVIARAIRKLMIDVSDRGQDALLERLVASGLTPDTLMPVIRSLPPQWFGDSTWFEESMAPTLGYHTPEPFRLASFGDSDEESLTGDDLLGDGDLLDENESLGDGDLLGSEDLMGEDALLEDPLANGSSDPLAEPVSPSDQNWAVEPSSLVPRGGWYRDNVRLTIRYRGRGHSDEVLASMIETFAQLSHGDQLRDRFFELPSVKACVECHASATRFPSLWRSSPKIGDRSQFTKFAHGPHLNVSALGDCVHCHQVNELPSELTLGEPGADATVEPSEFHPITRESCAACHTPAAAGDDCTTCHRYHIGP